MGTEFTPIFLFILVAIFTAISMLAINAIIGPRKITAVNVPVYPNHTDRSVFINQQAIPMLVQETLSAQFTGGINMISGASDSSSAFIQSLQSALLAAHKV